MLLILNFIQILDFIMRKVTVYITNKEYNHFLKLVKNLHYVKKIETDDEEPTEDSLENIKAGLEEVRLFKQGKLKKLHLQKSF